MLGEGIFTQDGRPWKHSRELLRRQFVRIRQQDIEAFDEHVEDLISNLRSARGLVDLQPHLFRFTLATTTALIFGEPVFALPGEDTDGFEKAFDYASYVSAIRLRLPDLEWVWKPAKFREACTVIKKYAAHFVQLALEDMKNNGEEAASEKYAFIVDLYKELQDPVLVRDQLVHVLIAGRDTTACLMSWTFFLLVRHPEALTRIQDEILTITGGSSEFTRAHINKMTYLRCVINECKLIYNSLAQDGYPLTIYCHSRSTTIPTTSSERPRGRQNNTHAKWWGSRWQITSTHTQRHRSGQS